MTPSLNTLFSEETRPYTGVELRPHFLLTELGIRGSGIGAFIGPCRVRTEHLVDWEDRLAGDHIEARSMLHLLGEFFGTSLREGVLFQRLLMSVAHQQLLSCLPPGALRDSVIRDGDDLFVGERKLSVSIVTASPVSLLLHVGINVDPAGAPVKAIGLAELGIDPRDWGGILLENTAREWAEIEWACAKVRPVI